MQYVNRFMQIRFNLEFREMSERARERAEMNLTILAMAMDAPEWAEWGI
jgi:hypothetical protein